MKVEFSSPARSRPQWGFWWMQPVPGIRLNESPAASSLAMPNIHCPSWLTLAMGRSETSRGPGAAGSAARDRLPTASGAKPSDCRVAKPPVRYTIVRSPASSRNPGAVRVITSYAS